MKEKEYDFSNHAEILKAMDDLYEIDSRPSSEIKKPLIHAIEEFLRTRTNSELIDMRDMEPDFWDYEWLNDAWHTEIDSRDIPIDSQVRELLNQWHPEWAGMTKGTLRQRFIDMEKQVEGLQKKVDKITKLLENFEIKMSVADALKL